MSILKSVIYLCLFITVTNSSASFAESIPLFRQGKVIGQINSHEMTNVLGPKDQLNRRKFEKFLKTNFKKLFGAPRNSKMQISLRLKQYLPLPDRTVYRFIQGGEKNGGFAFDVTGNELIFTTDISGNVISVSTSLDVNFKREERDRPPLTVDDRNGKFEILILDFQQTTFFYLLDPIYLRSVDGKILSQSEKATPEMHLALNNAISATNYFINQFSFKSYDGKGTDLRVYLNDLDPNAAWSSISSPLGHTHFAITGTDGTELINLNSYDVVSHEISHGVLKTIADLTNQKESGALNEHLADVFTALSKAHLAGGLIPDWHLFGSENLSPSARRTMTARGDQPTMRNLLEPDRSFRPAPRTLTEHLKKNPTYFECVPDLSNDNCFTHAVGSMLNRSFALIFQGLGSEKTEKLYFYTVASHLNRKSGLKDWAKMLKSECQIQLSPDECQIVESALRDIRIL